MEWQKMLQNNITSMEGFKVKAGLTEEKMDEYRKILEMFPMTSTAYYLSLINWSDPDDPIRKMCIPSIEELNMTGQFDTSGEGDSTVMSGMQHKYDETMLILSTHRCAMYCRHCFRKRLVGISDDETATNFDEMVAYIQEHTEISNVLISGGDSFLNSNETIKKYLEALCGIEHLDFIRFGTRIPVVLPMRIYDDPKLLEILENYNNKKKIYVVTQFNHSNEITPEAIKAVNELLKAGLGVRNQTVLLKGINDSGIVLGKLLKDLTAIGVIPYYIFQCRPVSGVGTHFQVPLKKGWEIVEAAKQMQNGFGKSLRYIMSHYSGKIEILGMMEGKMLFKYHQARDKKDYGRIFLHPLEEEQAWLEN